MDRRMIKEHAKASFRMRYWPIVGIELLAGVLVGGSGSFSFNFSSNNTNWNQFFNDASLAEYAKTIYDTSMIIGALLSVIGLVYVFLFGNVIQVGISGIRLSSYRQQGFRFQDLFKGLKQYKRMVGTMALMTLNIMIGFFVFIIPGIIAAYGLFEVPYLLAEDPNLSGMEAIRRSWADMRGFKGKLFGLHMSFFGWIVLSILTCGVLAVFYTGPFMTLSETGFYLERQKLREAEQTAGN